MYKTDAGPGRSCPAALRRILCALAALVLFLPLLSAPARAEEGRYTSLEQLNGKTIGIQTGSIFDAVVKETLPDAQFVYYDTFADLSAALASGRIDGFPGDEPVLRLMAAEDDRLVILPEPFDSFDFGVLAAKTEEGRQLCEEFNAWLEGYRESGELERMTAKWIDGPEEEKTVPDYASLPAPKGILRMGTEGTYPPMNYYRGKELVGLEVELAARFCEDCGYGLSLTVMNFDGILPAVASGKVDFAMDGIAITEERLESVSFSEPYYVCKTLMTVLGGPKGGASLWEKAVASFQRTFLREGRWKLFAEGVGNTLLITVLSILFGTVLGFAVYMLCRGNGRIANAVSGAAMYLIQGMPTVVILMILFHIVFGSGSLGGEAVSVIAFTLIFGSGVFGLLEMGVGAVDRGQTEAAYALGNSDLTTFFRIVLPQALPHILPAYRGAVKDLLKGTSVVGYIAVQDLTKMGDIVRSRTYEAFFPLIAVAIVYFVLEGLLDALIRCLERGIDPRRRTREDVLKGVKTDDPN